MSPPILPPEREVDCACERPLARPVLRDHTGVNQRVTACMRCGAVSVVEALIDEPRPHDVRCVGNRVLTIEGSALRWIGAFPRRAGDAMDWPRAVLLASSLRCADEASLRAAEDACARAQEGLSFADRLRLAGVPAEPPPASLPPSLKLFADTQSGLALDASTPLDELIRRARYSDHAAPFALALLQSRPELDDTLADWLASPEGRSDALTVIARAGRSSGRLRAGLVALLDDASSSANELRAAAAALEAPGSPDPDASAALRRAAARVRAGDYYLAKYLDDAAARLVRSPLASRPARR